jgi:hypothetical protein
VSGSTELESIFVTSGVTTEGKPFCTVAAHGDGGVILLGQLDPATVRSMALQWIESAEAAEQDAAVLRVCHKLELPIELAGAVVTELHAMRGEDDA